MGIEFFIYWAIFLTLALWLSILTGDHVNHKNNTRDKFKQHNKSITSLEFTVDDVIKTLDALKKDK